MALKSSILHKILFVLTIVPAIFQDLPSVNVFGTIARSPVVFIAPIVFFIIIVIGGRIKLQLIPKYYLYYFIVSVLTSLIMMLIAIIFFTHGSWYAYDEFFPLKLFKASQYTLIFFFFIYNVYWLIDKVDLNFILNVFQYTLAFLFLYGCAEFIDPYPIRFIHSFFVEEWKIRLVLTGPEPSTTMLLFACVAFCAIAIRMYLKKNVVVTILISILSLVILLAIGSKSGVAFIVISLLWVMRRNFSLKFLLLSIVVSVPIVLFFINYVIPELLSDIEGFTSFSTRSTTMLVAVKSLFIYPFGQGYGTHIVYFPEMLLPMNAFLSNLLQLPLLNYELQDMVDTGRYLGVKSGILQEVLYNGITAVVFFYFLFKYYFNQIKLLNTYSLKVFFAFTGVFCVLELLLTAELLTAYYFLFPFMVVAKINKCALK